MKLNKSNIALFAGILLFVILRLSYLGDAPFINDEPKLILNAKNHIQGGTFPFLGLSGSQAIPYGPFATWFYALCLLLSKDLTFALWIHALFSLAGIFFFFRALLLLVDRTSALWTTLLCLSSPYLFFYGRNPWDISIFVFLGGLVFYCMACIKDRAKLWPLFGFSFATASMVSLHLSSLFVVGALWIFLAYKIFQETKFTYRLLILMGFSVISFLTLLTPYAFGLFEFFSSPRLENPSTAHHYIGDGRQAWWILVRSLNFLSSWGFKYFLQPEEKEFFSRFGQILAAFFYHDIIGWILKFITIISLGNFFVHLRKRKVQWLECVLVAVFISHLFMLYIANYSVHPHYYLISWFGLFALLAFRQNIFFRIVLGIGATANLVFLLFLIGFIHENGGTRGYSYATTFAHQKETINKICEMGKTLPNEVVRVNTSGVTWFPHAFQAWAGSQTACEGKKWTLVDVPPFDIKVTYLSHDNVLAKWAVLRE